MSTIVAVAAVIIAVAILSALVGIVLAPRGHASRGRS